MADQLSQADLDGIIPHLAYEFRMLESTSRMLQLWHPHSTTLANGQWSATLESFATHARNLIEFLFLGGGPRYARAEHFFPSGAQEWQQVRGAFEGSFFQNVYRQACQQISHLTYERIYFSDADREWWFVEIAARIRQKLGELRDVARRASQTGLATAIDGMLGAVGTAPAPAVSSSPEYSELVVTSSTGPKASSSPASTSLARITGKTCG